MDRQLRIHRIKLRADLFLEQINRSDGLLHAHVAEDELANEIVGGGVFELLC